MAVECYIIIQPKKNEKLDINAATGTEPLFHIGYIAERSNKTIAVFSKKIHLLPKMCLTMCDDLLIFLIFKKKNVEFWLLEVFQSNPMKTTDVICILKWNGIFN